VCIDVGEIVDIVESR